MKLENSRTTIYVKGRLFNQCKFLLINIPVNDISSFDEIDSVDDAAEKLDHSLEKKSPITPETEFWGHCSNLQVWVENNYNTQLLHSSLAFPLLKKLTEQGDEKHRFCFPSRICEFFL